MFLRSCTVYLLAKVALVQSQPSAGPSVASFLSNTPYLQTFSGLVSTTRPSLTNVTVFAPTDESFHALDGFLSKLRRDEYRLHAKDFVNYHIVQGRVKVSTQTEMRTAAMENITLTGGQSNPRVVSPGKQMSHILHENMEQSDGIVHSINKPLMPFWLGYDQSSIVSQLNHQSGNQFSAFQRMMQAAGITTLPAQTTLLLPVNRAIPVELQERLLHPNNLALLTKVVQFHIVPKILSFEILSSPGSLPGRSVETTMEGSDVLIDATEFGVSFGGANATNYVLVQDGIVYPVNKLLFPSSLSEPATNPVARDDEVVPTLFLYLLQRSSVANMPSIFIPIGSAFHEDLGAAYLDLLRHQEDYHLHLEGLMSYHSTSVAIDQIATTTGQESVLMTLGGTTQAFRSEGSLYLDSPNNPPSKVVADDGSFAVIDRALLPAWITWSPLEYMNDFELSFPLSRYRYFLELIVAANMESLFEPTGDGKLTVLAPENDAISWGHRFYFLYMPENTPALQDLLRYHIVPDLVNYQQLASGPLSTMLGSHTISVSKEAGHLKMDNVRALSYSLTGKHSLLYRMSGVLIPPTMELPPWVLPTRDENPLPNQMSPDMTRTIFQDIPITVEQ